MAEDDADSPLRELERKLEALERELQGTPHPPGTDEVEVAAEAPHRNGRTEPPARERDSPFAAALAAAASSAPELELLAPPVAPGEDAPRPSHAFVASPPAPPRTTGGPSPAAVDAARAVGDARAELGGLHAHLDELARFREQLERSAAEVMAEYDRLLTGLRAAADREPAAAGTPALDATVLDGVLTVDAGPFADVAGLAELERALGALPGVRDVHVRVFERSRALVDVILGEPVAFGTALRRAFTPAFSVTRAALGHVTLELS